MKISFPTYSYFQKAMLMYVFSKKSSQIWNSHEGNSWNKKALALMIDHICIFSCKKYAMLLESVLFNLTECIFVFRTVIDFLFSKLWIFPPKKSGKFQSLLNKKSMTVLKTKIHSVRLKSTNSKNFFRFQKAQFW